MDNHDNNRITHEKCMNIQCASNNAGAHNNVIRDYHHVDQICCLDSS